MVSPEMNFWLLPSPNLKSSMSHRSTWLYVSTVKKNSGSIVLHTCKCSHCGKQGIASRRSVWLEIGNHKIPACVSSDLVLSICKDIARMPAQQQCRLQIQPRLWPKSFEEDSVGEWIRTWTKLLEVTIFWKYFLSSFGCVSIQNHWEAHSPAARGNLNLPTKSKHKVSCDVFIQPLVEVSSTSLSGCSRQVEFFRLKMATTWTSVTSSHPKKHLHQKKTPSLALVSHSVKWRNI